MLKTYIRPMTETERESLGEELLNGNKSPLAFGDAAWSGIGHAVLAFVLSIFFARLLLLWQVEIVWMGLLMCAFLVAGFVFGFLRSVKFQQISRQQQAVSLAQRLVRGEVEITEVTASDVIEAEPEDVMDEDRDTDSVFLFDIGNRQAAAFVWSSSD